MTYVLDDVTLWTSRSSRVVHISSHEEPHALCQVNPSNLVRATQRQIQARTLCWRCKTVIETRAREVAAAQRAPSPSP